MRNLKGELLCLDMQGIKPNYSELGRIYGMDRRTVKKYHLKTQNKHSTTKSKRTSKLDKYKDIIKEKLSLPGSNKKAVYMYIKMNIDDDIGSYSNFRKYTLKHKEYFQEKDGSIALFIH